MVTDLLDGTGTATGETDNGDGTGSIPGIFGYDDSTGYLILGLLTVSDGQIDQDFGDGTGYVPDYVDMLDGTGGVLGSITVTYRQPQLTVRRM